MKRLRKWWNKQDHVKLFLWAVVILGIISLLPLALASDCDDHNWDVHKVAKALERGLAKDSLYAHLNASAHELTPERMAKISAMIEDAYLLDGAGARGWYEKNFVKCAEL